MEVGRGCANNYPVFFIIIILPENLLQSLFQAAR